MKKNFITVNQTSGKGNGQVEIECDLNGQANPRETSLNIQSQSGIQSNVKVVQSSMPFYFTLHMDVGDNLSPSTQIRTIRLLSNTFSIGTNSDGSKYPIFRYKATYVSGSSTYPMIDFLVIGLINRKFAIESDLKAAVNGHQQSLVKWEAVGEYTKYTLPTGSLRYDYWKDQIIDIYKGDNILVSFAISF